MADSATGRMTANFQVIPGKTLTSEVKVGALFSDEQMNTFSRFDGNQYENVANLIFIRVNRDVPYIRQQNIAADPDFPTIKRQSYDSLIEGISLHSVKRWFSNRVMFEPHGGLSEFQQRNLALAKGIFLRFDSTIDFDNVSPATLDVILKTTKGKIPFEFLSSGFKSSVLLVLGIIKEIEERFSAQEIEVDKFDGLIMIDEIDVHLHPKWQSTILEIIKSCFPNAQIIVTTHSPFVVQAALGNEVLALEEIEGNESGNLKIRSLSASKFGFLGWTIEEILTDVMGLESTTSQRLRTAQDMFQQAIDLDDQIKATREFDELEALLHPKSELRGLYRLQLASIGGRFEEKDEVSQ